MSFRLPPSTSTDGTLRGRVIKVAEPSSMPELVNAMFADDQILGSSLRESPVTTVVMKCGTTVRGLRKELFQKHQVKFSKISAIMVVPSFNDQAVEADTTFEVREVIDDSESLESDGYRLPTLLEMLTYIRDKRDLGEQLEHLSVRALCLENGKHHLFETKVESVFSKKLAKDVRMLILHYTPYQSSVFSKTLMVRSNDSMS